MRWDLIAELQLYGFEFSYAVGLTWSLVTHQPDHIQLLVMPGVVQLFEHRNARLSGVCQQAFTPFV